MTYLSHWIGAVLGFFFRHRQDATSVSRKFATEEQVHEINLTNDVDKVHDFAQEETAGIKVMIVQVGGEIIDENFLAFILGVLSDDGAIQVQHEHLHPASLPPLPQVTGDVEQECLEEQHETNPLVVFVVPDLQKIKFS